MRIADQYEFDLQGFIVVRNVLTPDEIKFFTQIVQDVPGSSDKGKFAFFDLHQCFVDLMARESTIEIVRALCGDWVRFDHAFGLRMTRSGHARQGIHAGNRQNQGAFAYQWANGRMHNGLVKVLYSLTDLSPGDGGFACIPGSHKANVDYRPPLDSHLLINPGVRAGDMLVFTEALVHASLPWTAEHERIVLIYSYAPGCLAWKDPGTIEDYSKFNLNDVQRDLLRPPFVSVYDETENSPGGKTRRAATSHSVAVRTSASGNGQHGAEKTSNQQLFKCDDLVAFNAGQGQALIYSKTTRKAALYPTNTALLLKVCEKWRTLDGHAQELRKHSKIVARKNGGTEHGPTVSDRLDALDPALEDVIRTQLNEAIASGLMVSDAYICDRLKHRTPGDRLKISSLGVVTKDRPAALQRCLKSFIENIGDRIHNIRLLVMDDSEENASSRDCLTELKEKYHCRIAYADPSEKARFIERLHQISDIPQNVIQFALSDAENCGHSTGANRNCLLLETAGELSLMADDDVVCEMYRTHGSTTSWSYDSIPERHFQFFQDRQSALAAVMPVEANVLSINEQVLGYQIGAEPFRSQRSPDADLSRLSQTLLHNVGEGSGKITLTFMGIVGDSGKSENVQSVLFARGSTRDAMLASRDNYEMCLTTRELLRTVKEPVVSNHTLGCMTTAMGYDNRDLLPPFFPVMRGQDHVFGKILQNYFPDACFAHLSETLLHSPLEMRANQSKEIWLPFGRALFVDLVTACFLKSEQLPQTPRGRTLQLLGEHLMATGSLSMKDFVTHLKVEMWESVSRHLIDLERTLQLHQNSPDFWAAGVRKYRDTLVDGCSREDFLLPFDFAQAGMTKPKTLELVRKLVYRFGEVLFWWPQMTEAAKELRSRQQGLAVDI